VESCSKGRKFKGKDEKYIFNFLRDMMDKKEDVYFTPAEAIEFGFADGIKTAW
jgi:hypothetical protein